MNFLDMAFDEYTIDYEQLPQKLYHNNIDLMVYSPYGFISQLYCLLNKENLWENKVVKDKDNNPQVLDDVFEFDGQLIFLSKKVAKFYGVNYRRVHQGYDLLDGTYPLNKLLSNRINKNNYFLKTFLGRVLNERING